MLLNDYQQHCKEGSRYGVFERNGNPNPVHVFDGLGGEDYIVSTFIEGAGWVPDQRLAVGEGFWITKSQAQDWIWEFWIFR